MAGKKKKKNMGKTNQNDTIGGTAKDHVHWNLKHWWQLTGRKQNSVAASQVLEKHMMIGPAPCGSAVTEDNIGNLLWTPFESTGDKEYKNSVEVYLQL